MSRKLIAPFLVAILPGLVHLACGSDDVGGGRVVLDAGTGNPLDVAAPDADPEATRPYALATGGVQMVVRGTSVDGLRITTANVDDDADVVDMHQEYYGIPWAELMASTTPPAEWTAAMTDLASRGPAAGKPVFLSLTPLSGGRDTIASQTTIVSGTVQTTKSPTTCYDFARAADGPARKAAYLAYVSLMIDTFQPKYLAIGVELNLFFEKCPAAVDGLVDVVNAAYDAAKAKKPDLIAFPTFENGHLLGYATESCATPKSKDACFEASWATAARFKRDRLALSTYPLITNVPRVADIPSDWFTKAAAKQGERVILAETGWNSTGLDALMRGGTCYGVGPWTEDDEKAYLGRVLLEANAHRFELVTWWADRDLVVTPVMTSCPCTFDATWCAVVDAFRGPATDGGGDTQFYGELALKAFGSMGIRRYDGSPKSDIYAAWRSARLGRIVP